MLILSHCTITSPKINESQCYEHAARGKADTCSCLRRETMVFICGLIISAKQRSELMYAEFQNVLLLAGGAEPISQLIQLVPLRWHCRPAFSARATGVTCSGPTHTSTVGRIARYSLGTWPELSLHITTYISWNFKKALSGFVNL
jgi:hypothetical protein